MFAFIEYSWLMIPSCIITILLLLVTVPDDVAYTPFLIFAFCSMICTVRRFFRARMLYGEQQTTET
ncbi:MAG: hypothetical protein E7638_05475 [Ruminococcaceae bacterium]|nr:hypothetical protein [Oscillospiraceae bacterium]